MGLYKFCVPYFITSKTHFKFTLFLSCSSISVRFKNSILLETIAYTSPGFTWVIFHRIFRVGSSWRRQSGTRLTLFGRSQKTKKDKHKFIFIIFHTLLATHLHKHAHSLALSHTGAHVMYATLQNVTESERRRQ